MTIVACVNVAHAATPNNIYTENQTNISLTAKQPVFILKLASNPTTGYSWALGDYNYKQIKRVKHRYLPPTSKMMGAGGFEWWTFRLKPAAFASNQPVVLKMVYRKPWETANGETQVVFKINVSK